MISISESSDHFVLLDETRWLWLILVLKNWSCGDTHGLLWDNLNWDHLNWLELRSWLNVSLECCLNIGLLVHSWSTWSTSSISTPSSSLPGNWSTSIFPLTAIAPLLFTSDLLKSLNSIELLLLEDGMNYQDNTKSEERKSHAAMMFLTVMSSTKLLIIMTLRASMMVLVTFTSVMVVVASMMVFTSLFMSMMSMEISSLLYFLWSEQLLL